MWPEYTCPIRPEESQELAPGRKVSRLKREKMKGEKQATHEAERATLGDKLGRLVLDQVLDLVRVHRLGNLLDLCIGEEPVGRKDLWERSRLDGFGRRWIGRLRPPERGL